MDCGGASPGEDEFRRQSDEYDVITSASTMLPQGQLRLRDTAWQTRPELAFDFKLGQQREHWPLLIRWIRAVTISR